MTRGRTMYTFLPQLPLSASPLALFGLLLVAGVIGGELVRRVLKLPRIVGYVGTGMLLGASGLGLVGELFLVDGFSAGALDCQRSEDEPVANETFGVGFAVLGVGGQGGESKQGEDTNRFDGVGG